MVKGIGEKGMRIRFGKKNDEKDFLKIQKEAFPHINLKEQRKYFFEKIKNKEIFVAEDKRGYLGHHCFGKNIYNPPFSGSLFGEELAVKEKFRGQGIGTLLMKKAIDYCKELNVKMFYLGTGDFKGNKAIKLYKRQGFVQVGKLKDIHPDSTYDYGQILMGVEVKDWKK
jgi:GNAT superfamily N-acetyltransferase